MGQGAEEGIQRRGWGRVRGVQAHAHHRDVLGRVVVRVDQDPADLGVFVLVLRRGRGVEGVDVVGPFEFDGHGAVVVAVVGFDSLDDGHGGEVLDEDHGGGVHFGHGVADHGGEH